MTQSRVDDKAEIKNPTKYLLLNAQEAQNSDQNTSWALTE